MEFIPKHRSFPCYVGLTLLRTDLGEDPQEMGAGNPIRKAGGHITHLEYNNSEVGRVDGGFGDVGLVLNDEAIGVRDRL